MSRIATAQPSAARRRAVASPIPLAPPVITATRLAAMLVLLGFALLGLFSWARSFGPFLWVYSRSRQRTLKHASTQIKAHLASLARSGRASWRLRLRGPASAC